MSIISGATKVPLVFKASNGQLRLGDSPMGLREMLEEKELNSGTPLIWQSKH